MSATLVRSRKDAASSKGNTTALRPAKTTAAMAASTGYTMADVAKHDKEGDAWVTVADKVYDISQWVRRHPGGSMVLLQYAGRDITDAFRAYHGPVGKAPKTLASYYVGELVDADHDASDATSDADETSSTSSASASTSTSASEELPSHVAAFRELVAGLEGEFKTDYVHYIKLGACLAAVFAAAVYCVAAPGTGIWTHMLGAVLLGMFWQQTMFIGHDAGHGAITHSYGRDFLIGLVVGNLCNGVGITWWTTTHNVHHCACNSLECDPDIQHMPVLAVTPKYFDSVWSLYHKRRMTFDRAARWLVSFQHYSFYPIMAVARFNLYVQTLILLATAKDMKPQRRALEFGVMCAYFTWLATLVSCLPTAGERVAFLLISHAVGGLIHVQICLSHFSRKIFDGRPESHKWVDMQLSGTMDIDCPPWMDWFHGGLQFQTEHHLVPRMPRHKLRKFRTEVVQPFCAKHGLAHDSPTFWAANVEVWRTLKASALAAKLSPAFVHAVNLEG
uniref:Cytochrome b5 heme-binding domain-containing protein n=1 Tax=Mantoniella antarctica TaxID=81844 RepID=A0A7S0XK19_9CHLO|mmetsp:Transcript_6394/g.15922  ORF Transcript_6394/g.15922 Transcript_6394/m.15922 type:complete len:504 (+) Transcript_6394:190-1701(+)